MTQPTLQPLPSLAVIKVTGPDARAFLQGQLSSDVAGLADQRIQLASCNSAQGRVQAVLTLVAVNGELLMLLPATMAAGLLARLRKYVLRSKVAFADPHPDFGVFTATAEALGAAGLPCPAEPGHCCQHGALTIVRWHGTSGPPRFLVIGPAVEVPASASSADAAWRLAEIRDGLPQVLPETYESFVAQMLNLDLLGGISFSKGCYTGQEIIARTHYRGTIKRRMLRFAAACPPPAPGTRIMDGESPAGEVVDAAATDAGCELLAVISLAARDAKLVLAGSDRELLPLPLPYELTDPG